MEESIVKVEHLSHRYSVQWAIRDINFEITKNGIYGLLGSNGAGKSTTMNIMCGVLKQTEGDVYIKGISISKNPVAAYWLFATGSALASGFDRGGVFGVLCGIEAYPGSGGKEGDRSGYDSMWYFAFCETSHT